MASLYHEVKMNKVLYKMHSILPEAQEAGLN